MVELLIFIHWIYIAWGHLHQSDITSQYSGTHFMTPEIEAMEELRIKTIWELRYDHAPSYVF